MRVGAKSVALHNRCAARNRDGSGFPPAQGDARYIRRAKDGIVLDLFERLVAGRAKERAGRTSGNRDAVLVTVGGEIGHTDQRKFLSGPFLLQVPVDLPAGCINPLRADGRDCSRRTKGRVRRTGVEGSVNTW
jgi:hypothetical protein